VRAGALLRLMVDKAWRILVRSTAWLYVNSRGGRAATSMIEAERRRE
jgi:hypothetical protein